MKNYQFVIRANGTLQNFMMIKETKTGDLIISERGLAYNYSPATKDAEIKNIDERDGYPRNITVHPNRKSVLGTITINYKKAMDGDDEKMVAGVYNVKTGVRLFRSLHASGVILEGLDLHLIKSFLINQK